MHPRLQQLDTGLTNGDFQYIEMSRHGETYRVKVMKSDAFTYWATSSDGKHVHRAFGKRPSEAVTQLMQTMRFAVDKNRFEAARAA